MRYPVGENKDDYLKNWYVAQGFGAKTAYGFHEGLDLNLMSGGDSDLGLPIYCVAEGTVSAIHKHPLTGFGNHLLIWHGALKVWTHYAHCQEIIVSEEQTVKEGQQIATIGKSGRTNNTLPAHLHFALRRGALVMDAVAKTTGDLANWSDPLPFFDSEGGDVMNPLEYVLTGPDYVSLGVQDKKIDHTHNVGFLVKDLGLQLDINADLSKKIGDLTVSNNELQNIAETASANAKKVVEEALGEKNALQANLGVVAANLHATKQQIEFDQVTIKEQGERINELLATIANLQDEPIQSRSGWELLALGVSKIIKGIKGGGKK